MTNEAITPELREFILKYLDSVVYLEALLLLRASPDLRWGASDVARRLYISEQQAKDVLVGLQHRGLLTAKGPGYSFDEIDPAIVGLVDQLAQAYSRYLIPITTIIHDRSRRIREFADAFKLKGGR